MKAYSNFRYALYQIFQVVLLKSDFIIYQMLSLPLTLNLHNPSERYNLNFVPSKVQKLFFCDVFQRYITKYRKSFL